MGKSIRVLAIDDDPTQLELVSVICSAIEYPEVELTTATSGETGVEVLDIYPIDLVITDYRLPDSTGLDVLHAAKQRNPLVSVVVITAYESTQNAIELMKDGADDYLVKPIRHDDLQRILVRVAEQQTLQSESTLLKQDVEHTFSTDFIIYESQEMIEVLNVAARSAGTSATVLIRGESGTGKELIAQLIHHTSDRKNRPFVTVNVAALPETLVESELFGHKKGAFTGATEDRTGRFEEANRGTLFIDEIGDISPAVQVKLLRAIQFGQIQRVGDNRSIDLDVRIIAATNSDLEEMIEAKRFRADLYFRLNVVTLNVPPLRKRRADIPPLVSHFVQQCSRENHKEAPKISQEAMDRLLRYDYPGNVRELENIIHRAVILSRGPTIMERDLPDLVRAIGKEGAGAEATSAVFGAPDALSRSLLLPLPDGGLPKALEAYEKQLLLQALEQARGNQSAAARLLGIGERKLRSRMEVLEIENTFRVV